MNRNEKLIAKDIRESLGKLPPQCPEEEEVVLGALILERSALKAVISFLKAEHFYSDVNKTIFQAILDLNANDEPTDPRTITRQLKKKGQIELVGGPGTIVELSMKVSQSSNIESHARIIVEMAIKRELIQIASKIHHDAYEDTEDPIELLEKSKASIETLNGWTKNGRANYFPVDHSSMERELEDDKPKGETSRVQAMDEIFKWKRGNQSGWYGWSNDGKMESIENQIVTTSGFKRMGDIRIGDQVFDESGNICNVIYVTEIKLNKKCFKVWFNDGENVICGEEHLWLTYDNTEIRSFNTHRSRIITRTNYDQSYKRKYPKVRTTLEISQTMIGRKGDKGASNHAVQICKPLQFEEKKLLIHPYLLGVWLGDGASSGAIITNHELDYEIMETIQFLGYPVKKHKTKKGKTANYHIGENGSISKLLKLYDLKNNKHIPVEFSLGSYNQRLALLQGLMDTDGYINKSGMCEFCACNRPELANQVYSLICSLGIRAGITKSDAKLYGRKTSDRYRITFKTILPVFRLKRKVARIPKKIDKAQEFRFIIKCEPIESVPCRCIQVDSKSKLYLTGRSFIPTHNTTVFDYFAVVKAKFDGWKFCMMKQEDMSNSVLGDKIEKNANDIHNGLIWTYTGKIPDSDTAKRYNQEKISKQEHSSARNWVNEHFFIVDPMDRRPEAVLELFKRMHDKYKIDAFLIDPFKSLDMPETQRTDQMMDRFFIKCKEFAIQTNSSFHFIAHPKSLQEIRVSKDPHSAFKIVTQFMIAGGAAWDNNMDSQYSIYRPERHLNLADPKVHFWNLKQKKSEIIGAKRGVYDHIIFDWKTRRYLFEGLDPIDGSRRESFMDKKFKQEPIIDFTESKKEVSVDDLPF